MPCVSTTAATAAAPPYWVSQLHRTYQALTWQGRTHLRAMMEWMAGKATPSPSPMAILRQQGHNGCDWGRDAVAAENSGTTNANSTAAATTAQSIIINSTSAHRMPMRAGRPM